MATFSFLLLVWRRALERDRGPVECPLHMASKHTCYTQLPCSVDLCIRKPHSHAAASQENHGLLQSNQASLHCLRTYERPSGMSHVTQFGVDQVGVEVEYYIRHHSVLWHRSRAPQGYP